jgi:hypothetical protein
MVAGSLWAAGAALAAGAGAGACASATALIDCVHKKALIRVEPIRVVVIKESPLGLASGRREFRVPFDDGRLGALGVAALHPKPNRSALLCFGTRHSVFFGT